MSMRFGGLGIVLIVVGSSFLSGCGNNNKSSSTNTMYVATQSAAQVWGYRANFNDGSLSTINGSPFAAEAGATAIVIDPAKNFAYVANAAPTNDIDRFSIDANGSLVPISGNQPVGVNPVALAMDADGKFLFVANRGSNSISVFSVGANAALTEVAVPPCSTQCFPVNDPVAIAVTPGSDFVYVVDQVDGTIVTFHLDASTGVLTSDVALPPVLVGSTPSSLAMNPDGTLLYVTNQGSNNVNGFKIGSGGDLTSIGAAVGAGVGPVSAVIDPSGQFLYVVDHDSNQISAYRITFGSGTLTATSGSPFNTGLGPLFVAISPTNKFLYVSNNSAGTISGFGIDPANGNLSPAHAAVDTGLQPAGIAFGR
jgi:6-phosphogluconolactonase (cycloisomerase 2 family)